MVLQMNIHQYQSLDAEWRLERFSIVYTGQKA